MTQVEDRFAIQDVLLHYTELIDYGSYERIAAEIFSPDGVLDYHTGQIEGRADLHEFYSNSPVHLKYPRDLDGYRHDICGVQIRFDSNDTAQCNARATAWMWLKSERHKGISRPADLVLSAIYHDHFVRLPEGWRIQRRRLGQSGTGIAVGTPPPAMAPLISALVGVIPTWDGGLVTPPSD